MEPLAASTPSGSANDAALQERQRELKMGLRAVANSLREAGAVTDGYRDAYFLEPPLGRESNRASALFLRRSERVADSILTHLTTLHFDFDPPDARRRTWRVAPLGEAKCRRVWELFDLDADGGWTHAEFVEYMTALERRQPRPEMHVLADNPEVWRMFMSDNCELDSQWRLTFPGFLRYREAIEDERPLAPDLTLLGISLEWEDLERVERLKALFDEFADDEGGVGASAAQYLLAECGFVLSSRETHQIIEYRHAFTRCLRSVLQLKRTLRLFGYRQKSTLRFTSSGIPVGPEEEEEEPRICKPGFMSLVLSSWTPSVKTRWRKFFLQCRLQSFSALRRCQRRVAWGFTRIRQAASTGLLRASCLLSGVSGRDRGDYMFKVDVGPKFSTNATVHLTYNSDADSAATLHELKYLERDAECFIYIDLACRSGTKDSDAQLLVERLTWFIGEYFDGHLKALPFFHRWFVTLPTKLQLRSGPQMTSSASSSTVVRLVVLFTGHMDLYRVMQTLGLPSSMQFDHLLQRLSFRFLSSHSLEDVLVTKRLVFGSQWCCRSQLDVQLNRQAWAQLLAQVAHQLDAELKHECEDAAYVAEAKREEEPQQQATPLTGPRKRRPSQLSSTKDNSVDNNEVDSINNSSKLGVPANGREDPRVTMLQWLRRTAHVLEYSQELSSTWSFANLEVALRDNQWLRSALSPAVFDLLKHVLTTPGGLATEWKTAGDSLRSEFATTKYALLGGARGGLVPRHSSISVVPNSMTSGDTLEQPQTPSVGPATSSPVKLEQSRPKPLSRRESSVAEMDTTNEPLDTEQGEEDTQEDELLEFYDLCVRHLLGVHVLRAEAGTSGITCVLEGVNFLSLLPRVHQGQLGKKTSLVRHPSASSSNDKGNRRLARRQAVRDLRLEL